MDEQEQEGVPPMEIEGSEYGPLGPPVSSRTTWKNAIGTAVGIAALGALAVGVAREVMPRPARTMGATRSVRIEQGLRQAEIDAALAEREAANES